MSDLQQHLLVLSEPVRVRLLAVLEVEELGVGELMRIVQLPQSTVSRHLEKLRASGWIRRRSEGTSGLFRFEPEDLVEAAARLWGVVGDDHRGSSLHEEDLARLQSVIAARQADARTFFGRLRGDWEALRRELFGDAFLLPTLLSLLPEALVVADLGCGTGEALVALAPNVRRVIGVDREPGMLEVAAERTAGLANVELRRGGLDAVPIADGEADAVLCMLVLHHVEPLDRAFAELRRICGDGGRVVVLDMIAHEREEYRQTMGHVHLGFSEADLCEAARAAGLTVHAWRALPPTAEAQGPPLFLAVLRPG